MLLNKTIDVYISGSSHSRFRIQLHALIRVMLLLGQVPHNHRDRMLRAELSFFWHRVYDPRSQKCVHFCDAAPELIGTQDVPSLSSLPGGTDFLG